MARNYAAEEQSSLTMYETLLTFRTAHHRRPHETGLEP